MNIIGISAFHHDAACCLIQDGRLVAAAEEERFSRIEHDRSLPMHAFRYCLREGGLEVQDVDCIAYYESPRLKLGRQLWAGPRQGARDTSWLDVTRPEREIRESLGYEGPLRLYTHHMSHAASSFFYSGFRDAAILTIDGVGEWATTTYGAGRGVTIDLFDEVVFPHSLGLFYSTFTSYLGFRVHDEERRVMSLAPHGRPRFAERIRSLVASRDDGRYELKLEYFDFVHGRLMYTPALTDLLGVAPRQPGSDITGDHADIARSVQLVLEEILLQKVTYLHRRVGGDSLCMAGSMALNDTANGRILSSGPFRRMFVQPAASDAGGCLGAAALAHVELTGARHTMEPLESAYLGPAYAPSHIAALIAQAGLPADDFRGREDELIEAVVDRLVEGKLIGWFHGRAEFGPRALGARSVLADPRRSDMQERLRGEVTHREPYLPLSPSVLASRAAQHFALDHPSPFGLETCAVRSPIDMPAITHVDGSTRVQTVDPAHAPRYARLLEAFERRTGCPVLLNSSLSSRGEPMVGSPTHALSCFLRSSIDTLVLEDFVIDRTALPEAVRRMTRVAEDDIAERDRSDLDVLHNFL